MECFTTDVSQVCSTNVKICFLGGQLSTFPSIPSISAISLKFSNFLKPKVLSHLPTREATHMFSF